MTEPKNILIVQPSWVGDAVMATPTLRALRSRYPSAKITYLMRRYVKPIYAGMPWADRLISHRTERSARGLGKASTVALASRLRKARFDLAILLPNSFRSAMICRLAGIDRIVGYDRDGRHFLLSDRIPVPNRVRGRFVPFPIVPYYLGIARHLDADVSNRTMQLFVTDAERNEAAAVLSRCGLDANLDRPGRLGRSPLVMLNPGARYGASKLWLPERFAELSDRLIQQANATVLVSTAPGERWIVDAIASKAKRTFIDLGAASPTLGAIKDLVRRCDLMITNDTGPRHIAAAFDVPVVTIFGPTHPRWTEIDFADELQVSIPVDCGPCQLKVCPLDHRCMTGISTEMVFDQAVRLLKRRNALPVLDD